MFWRKRSKSTERPCAAPRCTPAPTRQSYPQYLWINWLILSEEGARKGCRGFGENRGVHSASALKPCRRPLHACAVFRAIHSRQALRIPPSTWSLIGGRAASALGGPTKDTQLRARKTADAILFGRVQERLQGVGK